MELICLEDTALSKIIDELANRINLKNNSNTTTWLSSEEAMGLLKIKSKTSLQNLRDERKIIYLQI